MIKKKQIKKQQKKQTRRKSKERVSSKVEYKKFSLAALWLKCLSLFKKNKK